MSAGRWERKFEKGQWPNKPISSQDEERQSVDVGIASNDVWVVGRKDREAGSEFKVLTTYCFHAVMAESVRLVLTGWPARRFS